MPFYIAYADSNGAKDALTELALSPKPTAVLYPDTPSGTVQETPAGGVVVQQVGNDPRRRAWVWKGLRPWMSQYDAVWGAIEPLRSRYRYLAGDNFPIVYLKEDETLLLRTISVSGTTITPSYDWLRCQVTEVSRKLREEGSSMVVYETITLGFYIVDPAYNDYG